jgi:hypothetical protein
MSSVKSSTHQNLTSGRRRAIQISAKKCVLKGFCSKLLDPGINTALQSTTIPYTLSRFAYLPMISFIIA